MEMFSNSKKSSKKSLNTVLNSLWTPTLAIYTTYDATHLHPIIINLLAYIKVAPATKCNNVYNKYTTAEHSKVSLLCEKNVSVLSEMEHAVILLYISCNKPQKCPK